MAHHQLLVTSGPLHPNPRISNVEGEREGGEGAGALGNMILGYAQGMRPSKKRQGTPELK